MIAAARAIAVELGAGHTMLAQIFSGRAVGLDRARRRDVIGGDRVAEYRQRPRPIDVGQRLGGHRHAGKVGRVLDVGRRRRPVIGVATGHVDQAPAIVPAIDIGVAAAKHVAVNMGVDQRTNLVV
jgi:hypothetical protein